MMFKIPSVTYVHRLFIIIAGIMLLFWSGLEDSQIIGVVVLGWVLAIFSITYSIQSRFGGYSMTKQKVIGFSPLIGGLIGGLASLMTVLLMLFKDIRHAHVFPDYPPQMMIAILERLPFWVISGGLIAFGCALLVGLVQHDKGDTSATD